MLLCVPGVGGDSGPGGRAALLVGIPTAQYLYRNESNADRDMMLIVVQLAEIFGSNREWRLLQLVDNVMPSVQGTELGIRFLRIREELLKVEQGLRPVQLHPAEVAQVHMFDLRRPVGVCAGLLPDTAKASGFVVTTPTPRLLRYFCERLKHRGELDGIWRRDQVAETGAALVIDPKHTTVAVALAKSGNVRSLLARKHVLWPIYVDDAADATALWNQLMAAFDTALDHHLVVTFGMPPGTKVPEGMTVLPAPRFTSQDISNWLGPIGQTVPLDRSDIELWASVITVGCTGTPDDLRIEMVYEQLEMHSDLLTRNRNRDDLMSAVKDLAAWSLSEGSCA